MVSRRMIAFAYVVESVSIWLAASLLLRFYAEQQTSLWFKGLLTLASGTLIAVVSVSVGTKAPAMVRAGHIYPLLGQSLLYCMILLAYASFLFAATSIIWALWLPGIGSIICNTYLMTIVFSRTEVVPLRYLRNM